MPAHASPVNNVTHHTTSSLPSNGNSEQNPARTTLAQRVSVGARLATFDGRIVTTAVLGAEDGVFFIP
jgi:hypothetical protein